MITASVVSHGHGDMVRRLVARLLECPEVSKIVVTLNIPENLALPESAQVEVIRNPAPLGYGANHNQAFRQSVGDFFCVLNPDIALPENPFGRLLGILRETDADISAPRVLSPQGKAEDSVRRFPTLPGLLAKALRLSDGRIHFDAASAPFCPDWFAGMFMLFRRGAYARLGGFDEKFFLYYEDVDLCVRAWNQGMKIVVCPSAFVTHDARRDSHRHPRHLRRHLASMARYFWKYLGRLPTISLKSDASASSSSYSRII
ncbi:MAG: glycosyltransferase family 2 protein [Azoarcus sp.]|jgi:GT2 family glycosyltransferase|nr:glycosyltransferase family 2 protein [Azoarcus sp.]